MAKKAGKATIVDVAREAGIAVSSASVALRGEAGVSEQTRRRILEAARRLGYQPDQRARLLRQQQARLLGVTFAVNQAFHADVIDHLYRAVDRTTYDLLLSATTPTRPTSEAIDNLLRDRCETLILISPEIDAAALEDLSSRAAMLAIGSELHVDDIDSLHSDDSHGISEVINHLTRRGHRDIAFADGGTTAMAATRRDAYVEAMRASGLGGQVRVLSGTATEASGIEVANSVLDSGDPLPTAICAHNDEMAVGVLLTLRSRGIAVPDDVSIVGYDDTELASLATIQLTSVSQDAAQLARAAAERAITRTETAAPATEIIIPSHLVIRTTTGPPRSSGNTRDHPR